MDYHLTDSQKQEVEQILLGHSPFVMPKIYSNDSGYRWFEFLAEFLKHEDNAVVARTEKAITEWLPQLKDNEWFYYFIVNQHIPISLKEKLLRLVARNEILIRHYQWLVCEQNIWEHASQPKEAFLNTVTILVGKKSWAGIIEELQRYLTLTFSKLPFEWESEEEVEAVRTRLADFFPKDILLFAFYFPWGQLNEKWEIWGRKKISDSIKGLSNSRVDEWSRDVDTMRKYYRGTPSNAEILESLRPDIKALFIARQEEVAQLREKQRISKQERKDKAIHKAYIKEALDKCLDFAQVLKDFSTAHPEIYDKKQWGNLPFDILSGGYFSYLTYATYLMRYIGENSEPGQEDNSVYSDVREKTKKHFSYKDERFFGKLLSIFLKIDDFLSKKKTREEQRLAKEEKLKQAKAGREQREQEKRQQVMEDWQNLIEQRCRQTVKVFNGLFDTEISPEAVLAGEISGAFASIQSGGAPSPSLGQSLQLKQTLSLSQHLMLSPETWLTLEEGDEEAGWLATYQSENFLIWHELCHLTSPDVLDRLIRQALDRAPDYRQRLDRQAKEVVIDGLAMLLASEFYVHPDQGRAFATPVRRKKAMLQSHTAMIKRVIRWYSGKSLEESDKIFLSRLDAELSVHMETANNPELDVLRSALQELIGSDLNLPFSELYRLAAKLDPQTIPIRQSLSESEESFDGSHLRLIKTA